MIAVEEVMEEVLAKKKRFMLKNGFAPDRVELTTEAFKTLAHGSLFDGGRLFGMDVIIGEEIRCRAAAIAGIEIVKG